MSHSGNEVLRVPNTDRVNTEPTILKGLTSSETMIAVAILTPVWIFLGVLLALAIGHWRAQIIVLFGAFGPMLSVWNGAGFLARFKRNRPDHYYVHAFLWWRQRAGFGEAPFVSRPGAWELGRSMGRLDAPRKPLADRALSRVLRWIS